MNAGFDGFVAKPIEPSQLRHIIRGHMPARTSLRPVLGAGKRLIVADDDATQLKLARYRLGRLGFEVQAVSDGVEAVEAARTARPDAIVTDALMPRLDGFGVCLQVRKDPTLADVPVVLVTSSYLEAADRELAARVGADAYVVRTADLADVIAALDGIFRKGTPRRACGAATPAVAGEVDLVRSQRALQQLERQVTVNSGLMQRCSTLSAELSILTTVADALVEMRDVEGALRDILANCLDVAGAARGAIYTRELGGGLQPPRRARLLARASPVSSTSRAAPTSPPAPKDPTSSSRSPSAARTSSSCRCADARPSAASSSSMRRAARSSTTGAPSRSPSAPR